MSAAPEPDLLATQRWLQRALLAQDGPGPEINSLLTGSAALTPRQRFAVLRRNHQRRLAARMRELHPALIQLLGREVFDAFVLDHVKANPARSHRLSRFDAEFVDHLARTRPDAQLPPERRDPTVDMVLDLARFERLYNQVLDGPGREDDLPATELADLPEEDWPSARLGPAPCLRLFRAGFTVHEYLAAVRQGGGQVPPRARPVFLALTRHGLQVRVHELTADAHRVLTSLLRRAPLGEALRDVDRDLARTWLRDWGEHGFLVAAAGDPAPRPRAVAVSESS
ncbi:HvfC/BufC N-terminal domain-containing protein [Streptoalloteichus hindustanus]|uniref:Putative DNA-binding domain-containing protein n=1 Tax=Streptoalloteichus hindustanus TaxID=2017 RepID=A0A1M5QC78_STRHI|nr:DNA-binding domain-containing protein [Streptoalloteichus hindustanus]SHH11725.1 Putative DNA-binding domain-containing protein [Streptoalloteichus hindustanus]